MNKVTNIKERILLISSYFNIGKEDFFAGLGLNYGNFKGKAKDTAIASDSLATILSKYPDINPEWLLLGRGDMLLDKKSSLENQNIHTENRNISKENTGIPLIPIEAVAGQADHGDFAIVDDLVEDRYVVPLFDGKKVDFLSYVRGSSMYPKYNSGDVVACHFIRERLFIQWNKVYVIDTVSQGVMIKRLRKSINKGFITFRSDNKEYEDFDVPENDIRNIALVVGVIRLE